MKKNNQMASTAWTNNENGSFTIEYKNHIDGTSYKKTYKTEKGAKIAETRFLNRVARMYKRGVMVAGRMYELRNSIYTVNASPVIVSDNMTGKMDGIPSISTSCLENIFCKNRRLDGNSICARCFAAATLAKRENVSENVEINYHLLTSEVLPVDLLPKFHKGVEIARIESFGDVENEIQAINYINIIKNNPHVIFGWWTKNVSIVHKALEKVGKPENVVLIQSACFINRPEIIKSIYFNKVFTVYDPAYIKAHNITINCGARDCNSCRRCYDTANTEKEVNEVLK